MWEPLDGLCVHLREATAWLSSCKCGWAFGKRCLDCGWRVTGRSRALAHVLCGRRGRQRRLLGRGGLLPPLLLAAKLRKGVAVRRDPSDPTLRKQRLSRPCSEGMRGQDVCRAADRRGSTGCCQMFPGEATVPALSCQCYRQCPLPSQDRAVFLNLRHGFQETLPVWETVATFFCAVPCGRLSFAVQLMLSSAAAALLPRSLLPV